MLRQRPVGRHAATDECARQDALTGSFVLEWSPALAPDAKYVISSMCKYQGVPGGGSFTGANGGQIEWTGPPFKVRAVCSFLGKTPLWLLLTQRPNAYAPRSVAGYAAWFQLRSRRAGR